MATYWTCDCCAGRADHKFPALPNSATFAADRFYCTACKTRFHPDFDALHAAERDAIVKARRAVGQTSAAQFWAARGIKPGDAVTVFGMSLYGRFPIHGVACIGKSGPYVRSPQYPRRPLEAAGAVPRQTAA